MPVKPFDEVRPLIAASILSADFARLAEHTNASLVAGADLVHLDVMDAHFVPNLSFGPPVIKSLRSKVDAFFDVHLMIDEPVRYAKDYVDAGADLLTYHVEVVDDPIDAAKQIRALGVKVGIALNPATEVDTIFDAIDYVDLVLVMSVVPGFSGQAFMPEVLDKAMQVAERLQPHQRMEIDGGINNATIHQARSAGVDWFVAASAIFGADDIHAAVDELKSQLQGDA